MDIDTKIRAYRFVGYAAVTFSVSVSYHDELGLL